MLKTPHLDNYSTTDPKPEILLAVKTRNRISLTLMEEDLQWKTTFDGRRPLSEDDLRRKTTFDERRPVTEDDL